jgi:hypothetical protein
MIDSIDIVEQLRDLVGPRRKRMKIGSKMMLDAADEIEWLRSVLSRLVKDSMYKDHPEASQAAIDALEGTGFEHDMSVPCPRSGMIDVVERLRQGVDPLDIPEAEREMDRAADEIERLREVVRLADPGGQIRAKLDHERAGLHG